MPSCRSCAVDSNGAVLLRRRPHCGKLWRWAKEHNVDSDDGLQFFPELLEILSAGIGEIVAEIPDLSGSPNFTSGGSSGSTCTSTRCSTGSPAALAEEQSPKAVPVRPKQGHTRADLRNLEQKERSEHPAVNLVFLNDQVRGVADRPHCVGWSRECRLEELSEELSTLELKHGQTLNVPESLFPHSKPDALQRLKQRKNIFSISRETTPSPEGSEVFDNSALGALVKQDEVFTAMDDTKPELNAYDERVSRLREISALWESCSSSLAGCESWLIQFRDPLEHISAEELRKIKNPIELANEDEHLEFNDAIDGCMDKVRNLRMGLVCRALRNAVTCITGRWSRQVEHQLSLLEMRLEEVSTKDSDLWTVQANLDEWDLRGTRCVQNLKDRLDVAFTVVRENAALVAAQKKEEESKLHKPGLKRVAMTLPAVAEHGSGARRGSKGKSAKKGGRNRSKETADQKKRQAERKKSLSTMAIEEALAKKGAVNRLRRGSQMVLERQEMAHRLAQLDCIGEGSEKSGNADELDGTDSKWFQGLSPEAKAKWLMIKFRKTRSVLDNWIDDPARVTLKLEDKRLALIQRHGFLLKEMDKLKATLISEVSEVMHELRSGLLTINRDLKAKEEERQQLKQKLAVKRMSRTWSVWKQSWAEYRTFLSRYQTKKKQAKKDFQQALEEWRSNPTRAEKLAKRAAEKGEVSLDALIENEQRPLNVRWEVMNMQQNQYKEYIEDEWLRAEREHTFISKPLLALESIYKVLVEASDGVPELVGFISGVTKQNIQKLGNILNRSRKSLPAIIPLCSSLDGILERLDGMISREHKLVDDLRNEPGLLARLEVAHKKFKTLSDASTESFHHHAHQHHDDPHHKAAPHTAPMRQPDLPGGMDLCIQLRSMLQKPIYTGLSSAEVSSLPTLAESLGDMVTAWLWHQEHRSALQTEADTLIRNIKNTRKEHYEMEKKRLLDLMCNGADWKEKHSNMRRLRQQELKDFQLKVLAPLEKQKDNVVGGLQFVRDDQRQEHEAAECLRNQLTRGQNSLSKVKVMIDKRLKESKMKAENTYKSS